MLLRAVDSFFDKHCMRMVIEVAMNLVEGNGNGQGE